MTSENLVTTRNADLAEASQILLENKIEKLPVVDDENHLVGLITYRDITKISEFPNACKDSKGRLRVAAGVGVTKDTLERVAALVENGVDAVVIDTAHGHSANVVRTLKAVKEAFPQIDVVVGEHRNRRGCRVPGRGRSRRHQGRNRPRLDMHDTHRGRSGRSPADSHL